MHQVEKIHLSPLTEAQAELALEAADKIYVRASNFIKKLSSESELRTIIIKAFDDIERIIQSRTNPGSPTNKEAIKSVFSTQDDLERALRNDPNGEVSYNLLFDFIKGGRIISFMDNKDISNASSPDSLRDVALRQVKILAGR